MKTFPSPVLGPLLVVAHVTHVPEDLVGRAKDVMDDLAGVGLEVAASQFLTEYYSVLLVGERRPYHKLVLDLLGHVPLPLELALALLDHGLERGVLRHVGREGLGQLDLLLGGVLRHRLAGLADGRKSPSTSLSSALSPSSPSSSSSSSSAPSSSLSSSSAPSSSSSSTSSSFYLCPGLT